MVYKAEDKDFAKKGNDIGVMSKFLIPLTENKELLQFKEKAEEYWKKQNDWKHIKGFETKYKIVNTGKGAAIKMGSKVTVNVQARVEGACQDEYFSDTKGKNGKPFTYDHKEGSFIRGWIFGLIKEEPAQVGELRTIMVPASEAYGAEGLPSMGIGED